MISDRSAGQLIAIVAITVLAAMASAADFKGSDEEIKFAGSDDSATSEAYIATGQYGVTHASSR